MHEIGNWNTIEKLNTKPHCWRQVFTGKGATLAMNIIEPEHTPSPLHTHPHEQILTIVSGHAQVTIGEEVLMMGPGDMVVVEPNIPHGLRVVGNEPVYNVDVFTPVREDYII